MTTYYEAPATGARVARSREVVRRESLGKQIVRWATSTDHCQVPGLMEAGIPRKDEAHGCTKEVPR